MLTRAGLEAKTDFGHHLTKVESVGRSLFFVLRKSGHDRVTIGLVVSSGAGPAVVIPGDQGIDSIE